ncbi:MAG: cytochrome c peroxidase [Geminicoccaceae bacterium]
MRRALLVLALLLAAPLPAAPLLAAAAEGGAFARLKALYARPGGTPFPADDPYTPAKAALGEELFHEPLLSRGGGIACVSCHDPAKGLADGLALGHGVPGTSLPRHTPTLWNLAWAPTLFWDGRAPSLEAQASGPIENPLEMAQPLAEGVALVAAEPRYREGFAAAFPERPVVDAVNLLAALATFERTLVSPPTRFDRWIAGDAKALSPAEQRGFLLFNGKAACANCHEGWALTDHAFHDIGLPGQDLGWGAVLGLAAAGHAFKTPGLRELGRSGPYMHDGRFATLDEVLDHYQDGVVQRPSLSPELRPMTLAAAERRDLLAFLATLTADEPTPAPVAVAPPVAVPPVVATDRIEQRNRQFAPTHVRMGAGDTLTIVNDDSRIHNVRISEPGLKLDTGAQAPGQTVTVAFAAPGSYHVFCGIHPTMRLTVEVEPSPQH